MAFLPKLWASAKVSHELDAIRLSGGNPPQEVVAEIVRLAKRYGIVTPYTSYLVTEEGRDEQRAWAITVAATRGMALDALRSGTGSGLSGLQTAARAQGTSRLFAAMAKSAAAPAALESAMSGAAAEAKAEAVQRGERLVESRTVGDKTFYRRDGVWVDGDSEAEGARVENRVEVTFASAEYFDLVRAKPELARYFAVGAPLRLLRDGVLYKVTGN
jgi:Ca-activated chloride channel family protein